MIKLTNKGTQRQERGESWREADHGQRMQKSEEEQLGARQKVPQKRPRRCGLPRTPVKGSDQAREGQEGTEGPPWRVQGSDATRSLPGELTSSISSQETKILHTSGCNRKTRIHYEKVNIDKF